MAKGLTHKQQLFVEAYLAEPNGVKAARTAGYSGSYSVLGKTAHDLLKKDKVREALRFRVEEAVVRADEVLNGIKEIAFNPAEKAADRLRGYELLGKHLALFTERSDVSISGELATRVILPEDDDSDG